MTEDDHREGANEPVRAHAVHFYENETALRSSIDRFVTEGLSRGDAVVLVASRARLDAIGNSLRLRGLEAGSDGRVTWIEAAEALQRFADGGRLDGDRFRAFVGGLLDGAARRSATGRTRVYGEMVELLWERGRKPEALELEGLWNDILRERPLDLFCAYGIAKFSHASDSARFEAICNAHQRVELPRPAIDVSPSPEHMLALLQQKTRALEVEAAERESAEGRLRLLAEASELLAESLDYETTLHNVARLAMPRLADFGFFDVVEGDGNVRRIAFAHDDPRRQAILDQTRWSPSIRRDINLCALSTGRSGLHEVIDDAWMVDAATSPEVLRGMRTLGFCSMLTVPLVYRESLLGSLTLFYADSRRHYTAADLALAEELARRAAAAVQNARLYRDAQEASRIKDEFLATISHELRTPLAAILGWASILRSRPHEAEALSRGLKTIERNARAQAQLIDDLLDVSRIISGKLRLEVLQIDPCAVVLAAIEVVRPTADAKGVTVDVQLDTELPAILADAARFQQIAWNLLSNAVKFTPQGGTVRVRLRLVGSSIELQVSDDGVGIRPDFLPFIFERFRQADASTTRAKGGLGLGLAIVRHLAELHGGSVDATSAGEGQGATFTVVLPVRPAPAVIPRAVQTEGQELRDVPAPIRPRLDGLRVLVVEDDPDGRELIREVLEEAGAEVTVAACANEALESIARTKPHVMVSDIGMPGLDGYGLLERVRQMSPDRGGQTPAIALTAYASAHDAQKARDAGFQLHVSKPVDPATLASIVASVGGRVRAEA